MGDQALDIPSWLDRSKGQGAMKTEHSDIVSQITAEKRKKECARSTPQWSQMPSKAEIVYLRSCQGNIKGGEKSRQNDL